MAFSIGVDVVETAARRTFPVAGSDARKYEAAKTKEAAGINSEFLKNIMQSPANTRSTQLASIRTY